MRTVESLLNRTLRGSRNWFAKVGVHYIVGFIKPNQIKGKFELSDIMGFVISHVRHSRVRLYDLSNVNVFLFQKRMSLP